MSQRHPGSAAIARLREGEVGVGYWTVIDSPVVTEVLASAGYDFVVVDGQHGLVEYSGMLNALLAIDAAHGPAGVVRVRSNNPADIGQALDSGARGVIVPLVDSVADAEAAVRSAKYPPHGVRSFGPTRSALRVGPKPAEVDSEVLVMAMIETPGGLAEVEKICQVEGLDGVYIGPSDLSLALGASYPGQPEFLPALEDAAARVLAVAQAASKIAGFHNFNGADAKRRAEQGFRFVTVSADLQHLEAAAKGHLADFKG